MDVGYFFIVLSGREVRKKYMDSFLAHYHAKIIASGKVNPDEFTLEKLKKDAIAYGAARVAGLYVFLSLMKFPDMSMIDTLYKNFEEFLEDYPEAINHEKPFQYFSATFKRPVEDPKY